MSEELFDVAVVGGGQGGIYTTYRLTSEGYSVVGIDGGSDFGGVWYHNRYPGARVDTDSVDYCFQFSRELYENWRWPERYADAATLFDYHSYVADELKVRPLFRFNTWLRESQWSSSDNRWHLVTDQGDRIACRFLVMCTGVLSTPKPMSFPGLDRFKGEWVQTSRWPAGGGLLQRPAHRHRSAPAPRASKRYRRWPKTPNSCWCFNGIRTSPYPHRTAPTDPGLQDAIARNLGVERESGLQRGGPSDPRGRDSADAAR